MAEMLPIGTKTPWGRVQMIGVIGGERYYWMVKGRKVPLVSMMPADVVELQNV